MAKQTLNTGTAANDGTGDTLRSAATKINQNFTELYAADVSTDARVNDVYTTANNSAILAHAAYNYANTIVSDTFIDPFARETANAGFLQANASNVFAHAAFAYANTIISDIQIDPFARTTANAANNLAQAAFDAANTGGGGADLGDLVVSGGTIGTAGVSNISLDPNGEGYAWITVPNDTSVTSGAATVIGNGLNGGSGVQIVAYNNTWQFKGDGSVVYPSQATSARTGSGEALLFNKSNSQKLIGTKNGTVDQTTVERLVISGGDSYDTGEGYQQYSEGGDIYLWAGRGANGGDIKVDAGNSYGGDGDEGGTIKIRGGNSSTGVGGFVQIDSGTGGTNGGDIEINASSGAVDGGGVSISAGYGGSGFGGQVTIAAGTGGTASGIVRVTTNYGNWDFGSDGLLTFPNGSSEMNKQRYGMGDLVAYHDGEWTLGEHNGADFGSIGMRINPGIEGSADLLLPSDANSAITPVQLSNYDSGGVAIRSLGNTWTFGADSSLTIPGKIKVANNFTVTIPSDVPSSVSNWDGGGGWNQGMYTNLATTGGTGTGLTVDVAAGGGGYISINEITINTPGSGYTDGDVITIENENNLTGTFTIGVVSQTLTFANSAITFPDATVQTTAFTGKLTGPDTANVAVNLNGTVSVTTDDEGNIARWTYDTSGNIILPAEAGFVTTGTVSVGYYDITAQSAVGALASFYSTTANNAVVEITARNDNFHQNKVQIISDGATGEDYVNIEMYDGGQLYGTSSWKFHNSGILESAIASAPTTSVGVAGDKLGMIIHTTTHMYFCTANYDGTTDIWRRMEWNVADTW